MGAIPRGSGGFLTAPHAYPAATMNSSALPRTRVHRNLTLGLLVVLLGWSIGSLSGNDLETARTAVILGILLIVSLPLFWMIARSDPDGGALLALLFAAFAVKLGAVYFRLHFALLADAYAYDFYGREIAAALEVGRWHEAAGYQRTALIRLLTGLLYTITGPAFYGASVLWGWLGLLGMMFYYKAFSTAFPNGDRRLYMLLILFYPSLQLWTSSLGKDAIVALFLGLGAYGTARIQRRIEFVGLLCFGLGIGGALLIRPHIGAALAVALSFSMFIRPIRAGLLSPVIRIVGLALFVGIAVLAVRSAASFVQLEGLSEEQIVGFIESRRTAGAGDAGSFEAVNPLTPAGAVMIIPTILLRPFPWEAQSALAFIAAAEGVVLIALMFARRRSIISALLAAPRNSNVLWIVV